MRGTMTGQETFDVAVIGGGIAGVSAAAELAQDLRVVLLEAETQPGYHATGRSAAILAQTYGPPVIRRLTQAASEVFEAPPEGFPDGPLVSPRGLVRFASPETIDAVRAEFEATTAESSLTWLEPAALEARVPLLRKGYAAGGFVNDAAQDIDVHALLTGYLRQFRARGGEVRTGVPVRGLLRRGTGWELRTGAGTIQAGLVVNAAGAWADAVAGMAGVARQGLDPRRRSAITFEAPGGCDTAALPMLVGGDEDFYLKPEAGRLMASPADATSAAPCDARPEEIDIAVCVDRITRAFDLDVRRILSSWAGLRTFAPDGSPVCGFDPEQGNFFWLAGQGGYGVQTAPALAALAAALIRGGTPEGDLADRSLLRDLAPGRFDATVTG